MHISCLRGDLPSASLMSFFPATQKSWKAKAAVGILPSTSSSSSRFSRKRKKEEKDEAALLILFHGLLFLAVTFGVGLA